MRARKSSGPTHDVLFECRFGLFMTMPLPAADAMAIRVEENFEVIVSRIRSKDQQ